MKRAHFSLIGTGSYTAEPTLHARSHTENSTLSEALYNTYEAKKGLAKPAPLLD